MRITEILTEYKLYTDDYGYWIDQNRKAHPVDYQSHLEFLEKLWPDEEKRYMKAYNMSWVRLITDPAEFNVKGYKKDIQHNWSRIARNIRDNHVNKIVFDVLDSNASTNGNYKSAIFNLPRDRASLVKFINS
ncbi:MAG: hypothetical protein H8D23_21920 [Candidatus Brocadiales bacterium]|nr:hypothetical protein [Candidatus Brocadiales bacterium]